MDPEREHGGEATINAWRVGIAASGCALTSAAMIAFGLQSREMGVLLAFLAGVATVTATVGAMQESGAR